MSGRSKIYSDEWEFLPTDTIFLQTNSLFVRRDKLIVIKWKDKEEGEKSERVAENFIIISLIFTYLEVTKIIYCLLPFFLTKVDISWTTPPPPPWKKIP